MRRIRILGAAVALLAVAGCGAGEIPAENRSQPDQAAVSVEAPPPEAESADGLWVGQTMAQVTDLLGEPPERTEPEYWGADGIMHTTWTYEGAELDFGADQLNTAVISPPFCGETQAGIRLGSSTEELRSVYGARINEEESSEERIVVGSVYDGLIFTIEDDAVAQILLGAAAE